MGHFIVRIKPGNYFPPDSFMSFAEAGVRGLPSGSMPFAWRAKEIMSRYSSLFSRQDKPETRGYKEVNETR
jgi:hypothetical protein